MGRWWGWRVIRCVSLELLSVIMLMQLYRYGWRAGRSMSSIWIPLYGLRGEPDSGPQPALRDFVLVAHWTLWLSSAAFRYEPADIRRSDTTKRRQSGASAANKRLSAKSSNASGSKSSGSKHASIKSVNDARRQNVKSLMRSDGDTRTSVDEWRNMRRDALRKRKMRRKRWRRSWLHRCSTGMRRGTSIRRCKRF